MDVSFLNFNKNYSFSLNKIQNKVSSNNLSFKGSENKTQLPSGEQCSTYFHPALALQLQLLKDGYTAEEIIEHQIFKNISFRNIDFSDPNLVEKAQSGEIKKEDIVVNTTKSIADIQAIQRGYSLLKQKFDSLDVQKHVEKMMEFERMLNFPHSRRMSKEGMILEVLHYVDKSNVELLNELLDDENFNNVHLSAALIKTGKSGDAKSALQALKMAQEIGYDKEFSLPLAIIISEANQLNMPIIERMLDEQDFLSNNEDFICNRLMAFLRGWEPDLFVEYLTNKDLTLREIDELMLGVCDEY